MTIHPGPTLCEIGMRWRPAVIRLAIRLACWRIREVHRQATLGVTDIRWTGGFVAIGTKLTRLRRVTT